MIELGPRCWAIDRRISSRARAWCGRTMLVVLEGVAAAGMSGRSIAPRWVWRKETKMHNKDGAQCSACGHEAGQCCDPCRCWSPSLGSCCRRQTETDRETDGQTDRQRQTEQEEKRRRKKNKREEDEESEREPYLPAHAHPCHSSMPCTPPWPACHARRARQEKETFLSFLVFSCLFH